MAQKIRIITYALILALVGFLGLKFSDKENASNQVVTEGQALIGGEFELIGDDGNAYSNTDFNGQYTLVYFGYSFCPDVCPIDLQKITMALSQLESGGADLSSLRALFITIDPERDTQEVMHEYLTHFHDKILGLTGSAEAIQKAAEAYRIYYAKRPLEGDDYLMDHSSIIYLMGPNGAYLKHFTSETSPEAMARELKVYF